MLSNILDTTETVEVEKVFDKVIDNLAVFGRQVVLIKAVKVELEQLKHFYGSSKSF